ncbi:alpha/beta fold hydrolase [Mucilaginibacter sp. BJC16-A38]|uniref:alpha/beta hydrolase family protein n=1 Tax=Mucilaginibacter phenanthrenivorans TaxID=1234842 RepID=UPI002157EBD0|nr:alpha/beta fold hydrolase [Mucilaginibacter phenanthrenivorans]MCR8557406.1 alpha/beta fold hydrolase [Mucilaginibacter phenanthrenivorans]
MKKSLLLFTFSVFFTCRLFAQSTNDSLVIKDLQWDPKSPASFAELNIPSGGSLLQGFILTANGAGKHPTLLMLHGYPGNERNLDLAQVVRSHGWNVIYFDYRGSWGSQGKFSFKNCVEDVVNAVAWCKTNAAKFKIDTANITLFGHSMGGFVCLKALTYLPGVKKGFALSAWDIYADVQRFKGKDFEKRIEQANGNYFVLNASTAEIYNPVIADPGYFNLHNSAAALSKKQVIMLDEMNANKVLAEDIKSHNKAYFDYQVWKTDHPFTNKRVSLMKLVLWFLDK